MLGVVVSESNAIPTTLTLWAFSLKYVCAVCSVDVTAILIQAFHAVCKLAVVCTSNSPVPRAPLVISIDEANSGSFSATVHELTHISPPTKNMTLTVRRSLNKPTTQAAGRE
jgi:hypothetical protein